MSNTNRIWIGPGLRPGRRGLRPVNNSLTYAGSTSMHLSESYRMMEFLL